MDVQIQSIHFDADVKLLDFTKKKVSKLNQYFDKIIDANVYFKLDDNSSQVREKVTHIKVNIPGNTLYASETSLTFEEAVDNAVEALSRQLKKHKEKAKNS
ncbi:MAG: ribosome-associated translation inhibitor RaiA [Chitinophagales bacterium]|nr:ribosome-associated translation inhibitor RaiA [Chitinophagales bacterium]